MLEYLPEPYQICLTARYYNKTAFEAKIKQHEPTAVSRDSSDQKIAEGGQTTSSQDAAEKARRSGMTKGTAGAAETGSEYEQGSAGSNK